MKKIREFLENETIRNFLTILKVFLMVIASYLYLMYANYQQLRNSFIINFSSFVPCVLID